MIHIGLPKSRGVISRSLAMVEAALETHVNRDRLQFADDEFSFYLLKQRDIPYLLHRRMLDVAITSTDWVAERGYPLSVEAYLDWNDTRLSLLSAPVHRAASTKRSRCATEFPNSARRFFESNGPRSVRVDCISGSTEGLVPWRYDFSVDCVESGATLARHGLVEQQVIMHSKMAVVSRSARSERVASAAEQISALAAACS